ncbi:RNA recognition motif domain [Arabidopsis thaliana x Arabidopsis arenosa]|uniref:RNA recognition motif domain n=1 Tax=Arabidopsis thaliana x Arabidopsis arenosa TaxID=1240361 RepID=A0A8T2A3K1_9BRAS|nr:RNA recognition motif domain [Arabidopsis thaliana x Arabidopsis arenosa]
MASNVEFTCFVRGLDQNTDGNDLKNIFSKFGNVIDSKIIYDHVTGKSRRFGFVTFEEEKSMRDAIKEMNDYSKKKIGFQCFVHGLECDTDPKGLHNELSDGEIIDSILRDALMDMNGDEIDGSQINVEQSRSKCVNVGSIIVEVARPQRIRRSTGFYSKRRRR